MALPGWMYRDPYLVIERLEEQRRREQAKKRQALQRNRARVQALVKRAMRGER